MAASGDFLMAADTRVCRVASADPTKPAADLPVMLVEHFVHA
jgi:hypothetical protein